MLERMSAAGNFWIAALAGCLTGLILGVLVAITWVVLLVDYEAADVMVATGLASAIVGGVAGFASAVVAWCIASLRQRP